MSRILLSYAFLRLHRSCLGSSMLKDTSEEAVWHRDVCLEHCSKIIIHFLKISFQSYFRSDVIFASFLSDILMNTGDTLQVLQNHTFHFFSSLFIGSAAITLAIDLLDSPFHPSMDPTRIQLSQLISNLEQKGWENKLDCRLATILRHLINGESTGADVNFLGASETASITSGGSSYHGPPQAPFLSHSRNNSGSSGDWGLDIGMLGSPDGYLMPPQLPFVRICPRMCSAILVPDIPLSLTIRYRELLQNILPNTHRLPNLSSTTLPTSIPITRFHPRLFPLWDPIRPTIPPISWSLIPALILCHNWLESKQWSNGKKEVWSSLGWLRLSSSSGDMISVPLLLVLSRICLLDHENPRSQIL